MICPHLSIILQMGYITIAKPTGFMEYSTKQNKVGCIMDRRVEKTQKAIQEAYIALLMEKKTRKITISEVARKANIDRKTFYLHYESIEDILRAFCQNLITQLVENARQVHFSIATFNVKTALEALNPIVEDNLEFFRFISLNREYDYFFDQIKELMLDGLMRSYQLYFNLTAIEAKLYAEFFLSGITFTYVRWLREGQPVSIEDLAGLVEQASYGGLQAVLRLSGKQDGEEN